MNTVFEKKKKAALPSFPSTPLPPLHFAEGNEAKVIATDLNMTIRQILFP